ncbi:MAG TPA: TlpA disulfide reductase family protein [Pyrinomonadaceae bacterium]|jgi:peroxiredoxin|nr:TlpA disulfide reductase family protein [Pyrinomonadaceae bacterium]
MFTKSPRFIAGLLLSSLLVFAQAFAVAPAPVNTQDTSLDFSLRSVDGGSINSEQLRGDVVVLAFGASWLPLSRTQVEGVQRLADEYRDRDLRVYWVSTDSESQKSRNFATDDQLRSFARKNGLKIAVLRDPDGVLFKRLGVDRNQLPALVIFDKNGQISGDPIGGLDPEGNLVQRLSARINKLL